VRHGGNQVLQFVRNPWTTGATGLPPPEQPESLTVPAHERLRSHDDEELSPVDQSGEHNQRDSGGIVQTARFDLPLDIERQLLAQKQVLGCQARAG
jgi:hypothetical protein